MQYVDKLVQVEDFWLALDVEEEVERMINWVKDQIFERGLTYDAVAECLGWPRERLDRVLLIAPDLEIRDVLVVLKCLGAKMEIRS